MTLSQIAKRTNLSGPRPERKLLRLIRELEYQYDCKLLIETGRKTGKRYEISLKVVRQACPWLFSKKGG